MPPKSDVLDHEALSAKEEAPPEADGVTGNPNEEIREDLDHGYGSTSTPSAPQKLNWGQKEKQAAKKANKKPPGIVKNAANKAVNTGKQKILGAADRAAMKTGNVAVIAAAKAARLLLDKKYRDDALKKARMLLIGIVAGVGFILLLFFLLFGVAGDKSSQPQTSSQTPLTLSKTGPTQAKLGDSLTYNITVNYPGTAQDITITDPIPQGADFVSSNPKGIYDATTKAVTWSIRDYLGSVNNVNNALLTVTLKATQDLTYIINQASGTVIGGGTTGGGAISGNIATLLPNPVPNDPATANATKLTVIGIFSKYPDNIKAYKDASAQTGVPWQIFAGIHYREGGAAPNASLRSGRIIGQNEPDVVAGGGCAATAPIGKADGIPEPLAGGGCGFSSLLDSAINTGILLKAKVNGSLKTYQDLVTAASRYNGGGNANCGKSPYTGCPPTFIGEDDAYALNLFDNKHAAMYIIYCGDNLLCQPPVSDLNPGVVTVIKWVSQNFQ